MARTVRSTPGMKAPPLFEQLPLPFPDNGQPETGKRIAARSPAISGRARKVERQAPSAGELATPDPHILVPLPARRAR